MLRSMIVDPSLLTMIRGLRVPGQPDPVVEILGLFHDDAFAMLATLQQARDAGDLEATRRAAHRLKGAAANLGAHRLVAELAAIEGCADRGDLDGARRGIDALPDVLDRTLAALQALA